MQIYNGRTFDSHFLKFATVKSAKLKKNSHMCDKVADMEGSTSGKKNCTKSTKEISVISVSLIFLGVGQMSKFMAFVYI